MNPSDVALDQVRQFHIAFKHPVDDPEAAERVFGLRLEWISDEMFELMRAIRADDRVEIADAIADAAYFVYGTFVTLGAHPSWMDVPDPYGDGRERRLLFSSIMSLLASTASWVAFDSGKVAEASVETALVPIEQHLRMLAGAYDIPFDEVFAEVHRSNMSKLVDGSPIYRADGKVAKPETWTAPDVAAVLARA